MRVIGFSMGFLAIVWFAVPQLAANDPEPVGAEASLFLFSAVAFLLAFAPYFLMTAFRITRYEVLCAGVSGVLSSGGFFFALEVISRASSLGVALIGALCTCMAVSGSLAYAVRSQTRQPNAARY